MSSNLSVVRTKFVDLDAEGNEVSVTYGIRMYDDISQEYINSLSLSDLTCSDEELKEKIISEYTDESGSDMLFVYGSDIEIL